jgi:hypothetical protein
MYFFQIDKFVVFVYSRTGISAQLIPAISTEPLWKKILPSRRLDEFPLRAETERAERRVHTTRAMD